MHEAVLIFELMSPRIHKAGITTKQMEIQIKYGTPDIHQAGPEQQCCKCKAFEWVHRLSFSQDHRRGTNCMVDFSILHVWFVWKLRQRQVYEAHRTVLQCHRCGGHLSKRMKHDPGGLDMVD